MAKTPDRGRPGSPRARLFLALDLSPHDRARIAEWRDSAIDGRRDLRPIASEYLHLTLVFLGYRPEKEVDAIARTALDAVARCAPPRLVPTAVVPVPKRAPRLFAIDFDDEGDRAARLQTAASDALAAARFYRPERRPFWAHLTFARVKRAERAAPLAAEPPHDPIDAADVTLYRSHLGPHGARYEQLDSVELR